MNNQLLKKYANLLVKTGVNLQKNQDLVIACEVSDANFARIITETAYDNGARSVSVYWRDEIITKALYLRGNDDVFDEYPTWIPELYKFYDNKDACYINVISDDPDLLKDVPSDRIRRWQGAAGKLLAEHKNNTMGNVVRWTIGAVASEPWAKKVYPDLPIETAMEKLWECIIKASRLDKEDPVAAWDKHIKDFHEKINFLDKSNLRYLKYKNSIGTDVTLELPKDNLWYGGGENSTKNVCFSANIPTEEIFTAPHKTGTNGRIVSSMPLVYSGVTIENFYLDFVDGKVVDFKAEKNQDALANILSMDDGAKYLGEIALVPYASPISDMNTLFFETLFDENASCHFALGKAYPCVKGSADMSKSQLAQAGINDSMTHVDFMIGTDDLTITGIDNNGKEVPIFVNGNWA